MNLREVCTKFTKLKLKNTLLVEMLRNEIEHYRRWTGFEGFFRGAAEMTIQFDNDVVWIGAETN